MRLRRAILITTSVVLLLAASLWLGGFWLESSGGRSLLEQELERRVGLPVRLRGGFDLMLYPALGVAGGALVVGGPPDEMALFSSRGYEVALAPRPLLDGEIRVEWIRLDGGMLAPARFAGLAGDGAEAETGGFRLPAVRELVLRDFAIQLGSAEAEPFRIGSLLIRDFADGRETPFELDLLALGTLGGDFLWDGERRLLRFSGLWWDAPGGRLQGGGCVSFAQVPTVQLELAADSLDLDALLEAVDFDPGESEAGAGASPELRLRLDAGELRTAGAVARGVSLALGAAPACGS